jgi:uncharacterized protein YbgA (DUF1722 family)
MKRIPVYGEGGVQAMESAGVFTGAFMDRFPLIPVEEEDRLRTPSSRDSFIERVFTLRRFRDMAREGRSRASLAEFHADHELLILSRGRSVHAQMAKLVARGKDLRLEELYPRYQRLLTDALRRPSTPANRAFALLRAVGHLRKFLSPDESRELIELIGLSRSRQVPFLVPATLIRHYVRRHDFARLKRQAFLHPHPVELMLRNHA